jgi:WD40 repeat protein
LYRYSSADKTIQVWSMTPTQKKTEVQLRAEAAAAAKDPSKAVEKIGGPELALKLQGHLSDVTSCAFGQSGASLATGSLDHSIMLWNPVAGAHVGILVGHTAAVTDIHYSADGRFLLSTSRDHHLRIWHPRSGQTILVLKQGCVLHSGRFAPDGSQLLVAADDGGVCLWSWAGREGSFSVGQSPRKPNLFSRGYKLRDDATGGGTETARSDGGGSMRTSMSALKEETNPLSFEGQAHKGAMTAVTGFTSDDEGVLGTEPVLSAGGCTSYKSSCDPSLESARFRFQPLRLSGEKMVVSSLCFFKRNLCRYASGGEDGLVRKISTGRGAGKAGLYSC